MKEKAKQIIALCGVFICILTLLSSIIFAVANATNKDDEYYARISIMLGKFKEHIANNINTYGQMDNNSFTDGRKYLLIEYTENNKMYYRYYELVQNLAGNAEEYIKNFSYENQKLKCQISQYKLIKGEYEVLVANNYINGFEGGWAQTIDFSNVTACYTNCLDFIQWAEDSSLSSSDFSNNMIEGGLPITEEDLYVSYDYINSNHRFNIRNLSTKEIYIELYLTKGIMYSDSAFRIYTHSFLNSISNQYYKIYTIDDIKNAEYNIRFEYMCNAIWNSETYQNELQYNIKTFENFEEFKTYMNENSNMWDKEHYYKGNTTGLLDWLSGLYISSVNKYSAFKSDIMNYQLSYIVNGENAYGYKKSYCMKPNEEITIEIANNSFISEKNISYLWHVMYSQTENQYKEHSLHSFMQNETINNVFNNHYNDNDIYDADGNKVGIIDENGVIKDIENNVDIQVPTISVNSISDVLNTAGTFVQASYKILPSEVYGIIVYGVSVIILVGVTKAVLS